MIITVRICARLAVTHRGLRLGPRRIDHADEAEQHEVVFDALGQIDRGAAGRGGLRVDAERGGRHGARCDRQRPQRLLGEPLVALQEGGASLRR